jgi:hypothetical protein
LIPAHALEFIRGENFDVREQTVRRDRFKRGCKRSFNSSLPRSDALRRKSRE